MSKFLHTLLFLVVPLYLAMGQIKPGARQIALSNSDISLSDDVFSLFTNPAGPAQLNWRELGVYYSPAPFGLKELSNIYGAYNEPTSFGSFTAGFMTYGFELYRESKFTLGYSRRLYDKFLIGIAINYQNLKIENYGSDALATINIGGIAHVTDIFRIGFAFDNLARASYGSEKDQIPVVFSIGACLAPIDNLTILAALSKDLLYEVSYRFGVEYSPVEFIDLRFGTATEPDKYSAGIGVNYLIFEFDYAVFNHQELGLTHQISVIVSFEEE